MTGDYENKKAQVLKASINVFAKYGYHKTTLEDIAKQIGIKKTHFIITSRIKKQYLTK